MKVLVCGGRVYGDIQAVYDALDALKPQLVIQGGAGGADGWARMWASTRGVALATYPAPWDERGKSAGPIRNAWMLEFAKPDLVLAFPGGAGTADMVRKAKAAGVEVKEIA